MVRIGRSPNAMDSRNVNPLDLFGITAVQFQTFILVAVRCTTVLFLLPVFSAPEVPLLARFGLGLAISFVVSHVVTPIPVMHGFVELAFAILIQFFVGFVMGYVAYLVFMGIQFAGEYLDLQVGFAIVNVINPATQTQVTIIGEFTLALATLLFLISNSHLLFLEGLSGSFTLVPLGGLGYDPVAVSSVTNFFSQALMILFKIATPIAIAIFIVNVALSLMARVAPQMNVFVVGFPMQIGVGLIMLMVSIPLFASVMPQLFADVPRQIDVVLRAFAPAR